VTQTMEKPKPMPRNGVDTPTLFATLDAVKGSPEIAKFQFRASNRWISGTNSRGTIHGFYGVGEERTHKQAFTYDADHLEVLTGTDKGPTPVEFLLHALAACLTAGLANIAAARGVNLTEVESTVEGDISCSASSACRRRSATATRASGSTSRSRARRHRRSSSP